jgi:arylsulfatase A-like enzyme
MHGKRPNIVYIHSHDTGRYIEPYGYGIPTPNIRALAEDGVLFRRAFCANPTCSPSRAALLTGTYPHQNGMWGLSHRGWSMNDYAWHINTTLKTAGYTTALSGIQHIIAEKRTGELGYDEVLIPPGVPGSPELNAAAFIHQQRESESPFFLSVGFGHTHRRFPTKEEEFTVDSRFVRPPEPLPDTERTRRDMAGFITSAQTLDRKMGVVFDALKESGQWDNTVIVCTTDHGIAFPRMKCNLQDSGIGVMLIMRGPGGFTGGRIIDGLASQLDIFPTLCEICDLEAPDRLEGVSLVPLATGEASAVREEIHAEINYHASYEPVRCVRTDRYKYIRRFSDRTRPVLPNTDDGFSKEVLLEAGWPLPEPEALYDTWLDPNEAHNLVADPNAAPVLDEMRQRLRAWQERTGDAILEGDIPPARPGVYSDIDAVGTRERVGDFDECPQF